MPVCLAGRCDADGLSESEREFREQILEDRRDDLEQMEMMLEMQKERARVLEYQRAQKEHAEKLVRLKAFHAGRQKLNGNQRQTELRLRLKKQ